MRIKLKELQMILLKVYYRSYLKSLKKISFKKLKMLIREYWEHDIYFFFYKKKKINKKNKTNKNK